MAVFSLRGKAFVPKTGGMDLRQSEHATLKSPTTPGRTSLKASGGFSLRGRTGYVSPVPPAHPFTHHSPVKPMMSAKSMEGKDMIGKMMHEVMTDEPSTVTRAKVSGKRKMKMKIAIGMAKAREAGVRIPKKG